MNRFLSNLQMAPNRWKPLNILDAATWRDLSRLKESTHRNFIKFSEDKWKDLQLGRKRLLH